jgi:hypothetical protein
MTMTVNFKVAKITDIRVFMNVTLCQSRIDSGGFYIERILIQTIKNVVDLVNLTTWSSSSLYLAVQGRSTHSAQIGNANFVSRT